MDEFKDLEEKRRKSARLLSIGVIIIVIGALLFIGVSNISEIGVIVAIVGIIIVIVAKVNFGKISSLFKNKYLPTLLEETLPGSRFDEKGKLLESELYSCGFLKKADRYTGGDLIVGKIGDVDFSTCDVKLEERHVRRTKNGTQVYYVAYFTGRFFNFDFHKEFVGRVIVTEASLFTLFSDLKKIELESIDFNKKFSTYTNNEHSAFYILTPHLMEAIMNLEKRNPGSIGLSFHNNMLQVGINNSRDTFELNMYKQINQELIDAFRKDLLVIKGIVEELKLNRNIFM